MTYRYLLALWLVAGLLLGGCGGEPTPATQPPPTAIPPTATQPTAPPPTDPPPTPPPPTVTQAPPTAAPPPTATPTPTPPPQEAAAATATPEPDSRCATFAGELEIQILVGPAEAVGLEPVAVGNVPISAVSAGDPCTVEGQGPIDYEAILAEKWGTYEVTMDLEFTISGTCSGAPGQEQLDLMIEMSGEQLVVVKSSGFSGEYPWAGSHTRDISLPLEEGASAFGEGWGVVLHVSQ